MVFLQIKATKLKRIHGFAYSFGFFSPYSAEMPMWPLTISLDVPLELTVNEPINT